MPEPKPARAAGMATVAISTGYQPSPDPAHVDSFGQLEFNAGTGCFVYFNNSNFGPSPVRLGLGPNPPLTARVSTGTTTYAIVPPPGTPPPANYPHTINIGPGIP